MNIPYVVYFITRRALGVQWAIFNSESSTEYETVVAAAQIAVREKVGKNATITAIVGDFGAYINTGDAKLQWVGD